MAFVALGVFAHAQEASPSGALELSAGFLEKLKENTPFTMEDGERFFGPIGKIPSLNVFVLQELGYLNNLGEAVRPLPKYSPLGELLRAKRDLFLGGENAGTVNFLPAKAYYRDNASGGFAACDKNTWFVYVKISCAKKGGECAEQKLLQFDYNVVGKYFFVYGFTVNGKSVLPDLGFYFKNDAKYGYPVPGIKEDVLKSLAARLAQ